MLKVLDLLLLGLAVIILVAGLKRRSSIYQIGRPERRVGHFVPLLGYLIGHAKILRERWPGTAHMLLFWGFIITLILHLLTQTGLAFPSLLAGTLSFIRDLAGIAMLGLENKLSLCRESRYRSIFFQDPCYLTRYNGIYQESREIIGNLLSGTLVNIETWDKSFCCGGGGGHMWLDIRAGRRVESVRFEQIQRLEPEVIATACPFCKIMLDSAVSSLGAADRFQIKDISELLLEST